MNVVAKKILFEYTYFKLAAELFYFLFESFSGVGTNDKNSKN